MTGGQTDWRREDGMLMVLTAPPLRRYRIHTHFHLVLFTLFAVLFPGSFTLSSASRRRDGRGQTHFPSGTREKRERREGGVGATSATHSASAQSSVPVSWMRAEPVWA